MTVGGFLRPFAGPVVVVGLFGALAACGGPDDLQQPIPLYGEEVRYPLSLWDRGIEGETLLRVRVTDTGVVDSVEVMESSGHHGLDSAAVDGARELRFQPGRRNGDRVRMWANLPVVFSRRPEGTGFD
ncbi:MAG: energy transducer TonB [Gemmatimonadota bacterium]